MTIAVTTGLSVASFSAAGNAFLGTVYQAAGKGNSAEVAMALYGADLPPEWTKVLGPLARAARVVNFQVGRFFEANLSLAESRPAQAEAAAGHILGLFDCGTGKDLLLSGARILRGAATDRRLQPFFGEFSPALMAAVVAALGEEKKPEGRRPENEAKSLPTEGAILERVAQLDQATGDVAEEIYWGVLERALVENDVRKMKMVVSALMLRGDSRSVASKLLLHHSPLVRRCACEALIGLSADPNVLNVLYRNQKLLIQKELGSEEESLRREAVFLIAVFAEWGMQDAYTWLKALSRLEDQVVSETALFVLDDMR